MKFLAALFSRWTWRMAWRDSRASRRKLILFSASIVIGIAALVALGSFGSNLQRTIDEQAKGLLGADLVLTARDPFTPEVEKLISEIGGDQAREVIFSSMVYFEKSEGTRLVQVRALGHGFPYYGEFETVPNGAGTTFQTNNGALVDETLLLQFNSRPGDPVKIGESTFPVTGALRKVPGENMIFATIAPRVYIPLEALPATELVRDDSLARFKVYFRLPHDFDVERLVRKLKPRLEKLQLRTDTVEERKEDIGRSLDNVNHFLNLGGFIALLLGAIGVASAIHVHVKQKTPVVAVMRCLGCTVAQSFAVYLVQAIALGLLGAVVGATLGIAVQSLLPRILADVLPFQVRLNIDWIAVLRAMGIGFAVCIVFALLPLVSLRKVSPLAVLRNAYEPSHKRFDWAVASLVLIIVAGLLVFARLQTHRWSHALGFTGGIVLSFALLALVAQLLRGAARRLVSHHWPYVWRQGFANLYRPQNRTLLLLISLGLGTFLVLTLYLTNRALTSDLFPADRADQPNAALFDIQTDQREGVRAVLKGQGIEVLQEVPIVTMRISSIKGVSVQKLMRDPRYDIPRWALRREYRSTYRDSLDSSEQVLAGTWPPVTNSLDVIPISIEEGISKDLGVGLGDEIVMDVQGILLTNTIVSVRKVDWKRVQPNFFMVFPPDALEAAPAFHIFTARLESREKSAQLQKAVVRKFPNVSIIDLALVLDTIDAILSKIGFVIRFMALFTVLTGIVVLIASVLTGRYQRIQESILLRTLGASRKQVQRILFIEYLLLGVLAGATGVALSFGSAWALATFLFKVKFTFYLWPAVIATGFVALLTIITGLLANRGVLNLPPLEVLRQNA